MMDSKARRIVLATVAICELAGIVYLLTLYDALSLEMKLGLLGVLFCVVMPPMMLASAIRSHVPINHVILRIAEAVCGIVLIGLTRKGPEPFMVGLMLLVHSMMDVPRKRRD